MKTTRILRGVMFAAVGGLLFGAVQVRADFYMKQKVHTDAFEIMGRSQPAKDTTSVTWYTKDKARVDHEDGISFLFIGEKGILYKIDHNKREYAEVPKPKIPGFMDLSVKVTKTKDAKKIGVWKCRKYLIQESMGKVLSVAIEVWATKDIQGDYKMQTKMFIGLSASVPGLRKFLGELNKIKGFFAYAITTTKLLDSETKSTSEILECTKMAAPAGTYDIPAGYMKVVSLR